MRAETSGRGTLRRDIVVVGASAGGMKALGQMVAYLPDDLPAAVLITTHLAPAAPSKVAAILGKAGLLPAVDAVDGRPIQPGRIYAAVPDRHLLVDRDDVLRLSTGPRENRARPAVDAMFRSAARWCGPRVIGVVLSGSLDDGAAGLAAIVECGGVPLVQAPHDALFDGMPRAALAAVPGATVLPAAQLARKITELAGQSVPPAAEPSEALIWETDMIRDANSAATMAGRPVALGCPECGGGMSLVPAGNTVHYICHAGHSFSPQTFLAARDDGIETALWTAVSAMQEKATVLRGLAERAERSGDAEGSRRHLDAASQVSHAAQVLSQQM